MGLLRCLNNMSIKDILRKTIYKIDTLKKLRLWQIEVLPYVKLKIFNSKVIFLVNTPAYNNIGDHAIVVAEKEFLKKFFSKFVIIEIPGDILRRHFKSIKYLIQKKDIIMITGGGYLGNLWLDEERIVRKIISEYKKNKIVVLPQTIYFTKDKKGYIQFKESARIYNQHKELYVFLRDKNSYDFFVSNFSNVKAYYVPDIVLYLEKNLNQKREGILLCFRQDKEKLLDNKIINELENIFKNKKIFKTDMIIDGKITVENRNEEIQKKLDQFSTKELVITDRLHGMLFAAITGTPCIAFDNVSKKVSGVYEWIKELEYIVVVHDYNDFKNTIDSFKELKTQVYKRDNESFQEMYNILNKIIY